MTGSTKHSRRPDKYRAKVRGVRQPAVDARYRRRTPVWEGN